jgi:hypothetical protein
MVLIAMWFFVLGLLTTGIGIYRSMSGKSSAEPDELSVLSWFLAWWIYLPIFTVRYIKHKINGKTL